MLILPFNGIKKQDMFLVLGSLVFCCWLSPISNKEMDMKTQLGDVWILGMPFFRLLARRHRQMGGGFHFVNSWDVYPLSSSTSCTIRASLIVFWQVKQVLKMRLFFFKCFSNVCWMCTPSLITIFPSLPKATTTPLSTVRGRSCNVQKQARIANPSPCMRARMVPGIFFFKRHRIAE